jgi:hypothetical protein
LQLADIAATSLRRAFNNHLQKSGWEFYGRLLIRKRVVPFVQLGLPEPPKPTLEGHALKVWRVLAKHAKNMILD